MIFQGAQINKVWVIKLKDGSLDKWSVIKFCPFK